MLTVARSFAIAAESVDLRKNDCFNRSFLLFSFTFLAILHAVWLLSCFFPAGLCEVSALEALLPSQKYHFLSNMLEF